MAKELKYSEDARTLILNGVNALANAVKVLLDLREETLSFKNLSALLTSQKMVYLLLKKLN